MSNISEGILILITIICLLSIIGIVYLIFIMRKILIVTKKIDYLVEDFTYKSELMNPSIETLSKLSSYVDVFDAVTKKNINSAVKYFSRNKDLMYKLSEKLKNYIEDEDKKEKK